MFQLLRQRFPGAIGKLAGLVAALGGDCRPHSRHTGVSSPSQTLEKEFDRLTTAVMAAAGLVALEDDIIVLPVFPAGIIARLQLLF